jgi:hypothetical protein
LTVNNQAVTQCLVGALDVVKIGAYTIKTKIKAMEAHPEKTEGLNAAFENPAPPSASHPSLSESEALTRLARTLPSIMDDAALEPVDMDELLADDADEGLDDDWDGMDEPTEDLTDFDFEDDEPADTPDVLTDEETRSAHAVDIDWDECTDELQLDPIEPVATSPEPVLAAAPAKTPETVESAIYNTFPASFFTVIEDEEDDEDDDMPAAFSLRDKLVGQERNTGRSARGEKVLEVITLRKDNVLGITHLKEKGGHVLIDDADHFCRVDHDEKHGTRLFFSEPLLGTINRHGDTLFPAEKKFSPKALLGGGKTYSSLLPSKGEIVLSDGFYDYVLRQSFVSTTPLEEKRPEDAAPMPKRFLRSTAFKYTSRAVGFHIILMIILSYSITMPDKSEFKDPETYFVMVETENIHKPVKPKPRPKPVIPAPSKIEKAKKPETKPSTQVATLNPKKQPVKAEKPKAGGGHQGTVVNRNVNDMGLLATLGMKTGIEIKPNEALASVTNMDAVTSTHAREARIKVGGLIGDLGDSRIAIPSGGVINNKGAADVLRSAGIGGKGTVAALESGNTGQRAVSGAVSAPLTKKVKFKGGGISREAVAKVINDHIDEINYCYETSLINDPTLMGKIEFEWVILLSGKVGEVRIKSSTVKSNEIHACIKSAIRTWVFPKPQGSAVEVSYPFVFDVSGF